MKIKKVASLIFILIIIALLVYALRKIRLIEIYLLIRAADPFYFLLAILAMFLSLIIWNLRTLYIFRPIIKGNFWFFLNILFAGSFFNAITPGPGFAGEPLRAHYISKKYKKPKSVVFGYVLGDVFFRLASLGIFIIFSVFFCFFFFKISSTLKIILELVLVLVLVISAIFLYLLLKKSHFKFGFFFRKLHTLSFIKKRFETPEKFCEFLNVRMNTITSVFKRVVKHKKNFVICMIISIIFWILRYFVAYFLFLSFRFDVNFLSVVVVITLAEIISNFSLTPGGVGFVETGMILLFSAMGIFVPLAILVSLLTRIISYFFSFGMGWISFMRLKKAFNNGDSNFFGFF